MWGPPVISVVGRSGVGKTTLIEKLVAEFKRRGYRVGTVKHHIHPGFEIDYPGKDSWRHAQAGSDHVVIAAPDRIASIRNCERDLPIEEIVTSMQDVELVFTEGYLLADTPKVEIIRAERSREPLSDLDKLIAFVTDAELNTDTPCFGLDDVLGLSDLIEGILFKHMIKNRPTTADPKISYTEALQLTLANISTLSPEKIELSQLNGRVLAEDIFALVNSPSADASLKDGYAVKSADIARASPENPIKLMLVGNVAAGESWQKELDYGTTVRVLSGAPIPAGAQAVVSEEFAEVAGNTVLITAIAEPGKNILLKGTDVHLGELLGSAGDLLMPAHVGLLASAGHTGALVIRRPKVAIIATGDEVLAPGSPLTDGKLFASNMVTLAAWCSHFGMLVTTRVVSDRPQDIKEELRKQIADHDALITSGGAWSGDRDFVVKLLGEMGWEKIFHRVRIGPGKAVGFGLWDGKPVFCLPGGPPSNYMAFLQLALPGLQRHAGYRTPGLKTITAELAEDVHGLLDWTQLKFGWFESRNGLPRFHPLKSASRLQDMAKAEGVIMIPEGVEHIKAGEVIGVQVLIWLT